MKDIKYRIRLKAVGKGTAFEIGEEITIWNEIFNTSNGVAFFPLNRDWEVLSADQYTGLKDKNKNEIYEGDILEWISSNPFSLGEKRRVKVYYIDSHFWCYGSVGVYLGELLVEEKCKIIGNIYDTSDLLIGYKIK